MSRQPEEPLRKASYSTDRECYRAKVEALVQIQVKPLEEKGEKPLRVSQAPAWQVNGHAKDMLFEGQYRRAKAKGECPNTKAAVLIDGKGAGSIFYLCQAEKCDVHNRLTRYQPTPRKRLNGSGFQGLYLQTLKNQGSTCRARREAVASTHPRSHPQEAARCSQSARLGDGRPRLLPTVGPRQPPPCLQAVRLGRVEEQNLMGRSDGGVREDCGEPPDGYLLLPPLRLHSLRYWIRVSHLPSFHFP